MQRKWHHPSSFSSLSGKEQETTDHLLQTEASFITCWKVNTAEYLRWIQSHLRCTMSSFPLMQEQCSTLLSHSEWLYFRETTSPSPCHSICSIIFPPVSAAFLPFPTVSRFIPPRTHQPSHYLLPASVNLCTGQSQAQTTECTLTHEAVCLILSSGTKWVFNGPVRFHYSASETVDTQKTHTLTNAQVKPQTNLHLLFLPQAVGRPRLGARASKPEIQSPVTVGVWNRRHQGGGLFDSDTKAPVFSEGGCIIHLAAAASACHWAEVTMETGCWETVERESAGWSQWAFSFWTPRERLA